MRLTTYFLPLLKEKPAEAHLVSHSLMLRAGMIKQMGSGIYSWLPLGVRVLQNISDIIRKYMNSAGCQEMIIPCIQPAKLWVESGRYDDYGKEMLKMVDRHDNEMLFGPTAEEAVTDVFRTYIKSYKSLPINLYQINWKFRDEIRPRFGVMRGREFLMKDGYSFDNTQEEAIKSYNKIYSAYLKVFKEIGVDIIPVKASSGPIGGNLNHEFHVLADSGESNIYYDKQLLEAINKEIPESPYEFYAAEEETHDRDMGGNIISSKGIEVGHIFYFGTKYSESMKASVSNKDGKMVFPHMGSYGIGVSRLVAAIIEASYDDKGIIWPISVAPFKVAVINLKAGDNICANTSESLYIALKEKGVEVLYDDTDSSPGSKLSVADLIGTPVQVIIGPGKVKQGLVELKIRAINQVIEIQQNDVINQIMKLIRDVL